MADKNGWAAAVGSPGGASKLGPKHSKRSTRGKKHQTAKGMVKSSSRHVRKASGR